ncbi:MAG: hypothetical protein ABUS57_11060, partial [Pseudomonadota bacterium]
MTTAAERRRERERWTPKGPGLLLSIWRGVRRFLSGPISTSFLRLAQRRSALMRIGVGMLLGGVWLAFGGWFAVEQLAPSHDHASGWLGHQVEAAANAVCAL